jgi:hypothetical protein
MFHIKYKDLAHNMYRTIKNNKTICNNIIINVVEFSDIVGTYSFGKSISINNTIYTM